MFQKLIRLIILLLIIVFYSDTVFPQIPACESCHQDKNYNNNMIPLHKILSNEERGVGIMDKGQIANYMGNYGVLSNFHEYFNESI